MGAINEISGYLLQTVLGLYLVIMLMRFLLQLVRADFFNPITQFLVRVTNPLVLPVRKVLPASGRFDGASLVLAVVLQLLGLVAMLWLRVGAVPGLTRLLAWSALGVAALLVQIYFFALLAMIILSWIAPGGRNPALILLHQITEPVMAPFRRLLPPMGGIDFSPILLFVLINVIQIALRHMAAGVGLHPALIMGL